MQRRHERLSPLGEVIAATPIGRTLRRTLELMPGGTASQRSLFPSSGPIPLEQRLRKEVIVQGCVGFDVTGARWVGNDLIFVTNDGQQWWVHNPPVAVEYSLDARAYRGDRVLFLRHESFGGPVFLVAQRTRPPKVGKVRPARISNFLAEDGSSLVALASMEILSGNPEAFSSPVVLFGDSGLGKTHLLHALAIRLGRTIPEGLVCVTGRGFRNEFFGALKKDAMPEFRARFRYDCRGLLIDQVEDLFKSDGTARELLNTLEYLIMHGILVVCTANVSPHEMPFSGKLRGLLAGGMLIPMQPLSVEARSVLLQQLVQHRGGTLRSRDAIKLAEASNEANTRPLHALANRLTVPIGGRVEVTQAVLDSSLAWLRQEYRVKLTPDDVLDAVVKATGVKKELLSSKLTMREVSGPRHIAAYLLQQHVLDSKDRPLGGSEIAKVLGYESGTSVKYALEQARRKLEQCHPPTVMAIERVEQLLGVNLD